MSRFTTFPSRLKHELSVMENCRSYFADWKGHRREQTPTQQALAELIRKAFDGVTCGESLCYVEPEGFRFLLPAYMPADMQYEFNWNGLDFLLFRVSERERNVSLFTPARRDCVTDYVNEKRLEELREEIRSDWSPSVWKHLLPWEKAALPPDTDDKRAAEEILCAYREKHGIEI